MERIDWPFRATWLLAWSVAAISICLGISSIRAERDLRDQIASESQKLLRRNADSALPEVPGGTGYGYYFNDSALLWTNSTFIDFYAIAPPKLGGVNTDWLYLTSTCRARLGTEALLGYNQAQEAEFLVFDWARTATGAWQVDLNLPSQHTEYLTMRFDEFGNRRQMCHVRNGTFLTSQEGGAYFWRNEVRLFNFQLGDWDLVYSYDYATETAAGNRFQSNMSGYWGPIVETFGSHRDIETIGFDLIRLFQDGKTNSLWLSSANSFLVQDSSYHSVTVAPNRSFAVYTGNTNHDWFPFSITGLTRNNLTIGATIEVASLPARDFQAYSGIFLAGQLQWLPTGTVVPGSGNAILIDVPAPLAHGIFRVGAKYNTGTLCVVTDVPNLSFTVAPGTGVSASPWIAEQITNRWDQIVVGLRPGKYTVSFDLPPDRTPIAPQEFTIAANGITSIYAISNP